MAVQNLTRSKKKVFVVVASLSLALVLLNSVCGMVQSFDMDKYTSNMAVGDFSVSDASLDNVSMSVNARVVDGVTYEFLEELNKQNGIEEIGNIYFGEHFMKFAEDDWEKVVERVLKCDAVIEEVRWMAEQVLQMEGQEITEETLEAYTQEGLEVLWSRKALDGVFYGIDEPVMELLQDVEGELDWEKFQTGDYIIATRYRYDDSDINYFYPGEKIQVYNYEGDCREYEVMAVVSMPYACGFQVFGSFNCDYILPSQEFFEFIEQKQPMRTLINVSDDAEERVEAWLSAYCDTTNPNLDYNSKEKAAAEFEGMKRMFYMVGGVLIFILAIIGILNFTNTMVMSIMSRKQELAMLEAVGMSGTQQKQMLIWEGLSYAGRTILIALLLGILLNVTVIRMLTNQLFFAAWKFTIWPILLCIPVILLVVILVPVLCYQNMKKVSVVERIRSIV